MRFSLLLFCIVISISFAGGSLDEGQHVSTPIIGLYWEHVEAPMMVSIWLMIASIARILFHVNKKFGDAFPDSALLIVVGLLLGWLLVGLKVQSSLFTFNATTFFLYLLPPIIFDAGYFMPNRQLFENFGSVMTFAIVGTIWNFFAIGVTLIVCSHYGLFTVDFSWAEALLFSSLISAVDPVAVITVFEEIGVNEFLFINVFGESLFNDGLSAVIFQVFNRIVMTGPENLQTEQYVQFGAAFVAMALGGVFIGVVMAFACALATRFTQRVKIVVPVFTFVFPYMSYLIAEMFGLSAIFAICTCGIVMKQYVKGNITHEAASSVKYFVKMLAQASETVVFMFLGLTTMSSQQYFDLWFVVVTLFACLVYRTIGVIVQCAILNRYSSKKFTMRDQFVLAYGGLRGAIAFGLLSSVSDNYFDYTMSGIGDVLGQRSKHAVRHWFERLNANVLKPLLVKHTTRNLFDASQIVRAYNKIALQEALETSRIHERPRATRNRRNESKFNQWQTYDEFIAATKNADHYAKEMRAGRRQEEAAASPSATRTHRPAAVTIELEGDEFDDIKDDYLTAINRSQLENPKEQNGSCV
ncbi:Sodium/hydrogen exchanger [Aphelenchoides fujianensis]|nr:Sodium/hydrogen exchanger [Aphelenchoides fujianensis]